MKVVNEVKTLLILVLLFFTPFINVIHAEENWTLLRVGLSRGIGIFDIDRDGLDEIIGDDFIFDQGVVVEIDDVIVFKADFDLDGQLDLVMYYPSNGNTYIYTKKRDYAFTIERNIVSYAVFGIGFRLGHHLFGGGSSITASEKSVPLVYNNSLYGVEISNRIIRIYNTTWQVELIRLPTDYSIVGAGAVDTNIYFILSATDHSLLIRYDTVTSVVYTSVHPIGFTQCYFVKSDFLCVDGSNLYSVSTTLHPIMGGITTFQVVERTHRFAVYRYPKLLFLDYDQGGNYNVVMEIDLPHPPHSIDKSEDVVVITTIHGVYIHPSIKIPSASIQAPNVALVKDSIEIVITGNYDYVEVLAGTYKQLLTTTPAKIITSFNSTGDVNIVAKACKTGVCTTTSKNVKVLPRHMKMILETPKTVEPYTTFNMLIKLYDSKTATEVHTPSCSVVLESTKEEYKVKPFTNTSYPAIPIGNEVVLTVTCSDPNYITVKESVVIPLSKPYLNVLVRYLGEGRFAIEAYDLYTGNSFDGVIRVTVNYRNVSNYLRGALITLPPGNHSLLIELIQNNITLLRKSVNVTYFSSVYDVSPDEAIKVADRVTTKTVTTTVTTTTTKTDVKVVTVEKIDVPLSIGLAVISFGIGLTFAILSHRKGRGE